MRPYGWRRSRSTNTSAEGQKGATSLSVATRWRSASRHLSFELHLRHLRRAVAKLSSVRGSTIALRSMPSFSTSAQNSASPEWRRFAVSSQNLLSFVIAHDVPNRVRATPAGGLMPKMSINLCHRRPLGHGKRSPYLKVADHVTGAHDHCRTPLASPRHAHPDPAIAPRMPNSADPLERHFDLSQLPRTHFRCAGKPCIRARRRGRLQSPFNRPAGTNV
jgi:hypothetical protein